MKKLFIFLLLLSSSLMIINIGVFGATETVEYPLTFYENKKWDIETGFYVDDDNYNSTNRLRIQEGEITLNNYNWSHILFWTRDNQYLGYMNPISGGYEGSDYLSDTDLTVEIPLNALWYSLTAYELAPNQIEYVELNGYSLKEVFEDNNFVYNNEFELNYNGWNTSTISNPSVINGIFQYNESSPTNYPVSTSFYININDKLYSNSYTKTPVTTSLRIAYTNTSVFIPISSEYQYASQIVIATSSINTTISLRNNTSSTSEYIYIDYINGINLTTLGIDNLTVGQMDGYYQDYTDNLPWVDGFTPLLFYSIVATYDREEVVEDERSFIEKVNDWFDDFNLGSFIKIAIALILMVAIGVILFISGGSSFMIMIIEFILYLLFSVFGWFPLWLIIIVALILVASIYFLIKGGS